MLVAGFIALCIARHNDDERDALLVLSVLVDAVDRVQLPEPVLEELIDQAIPGEWPWVEAFIRRPESARCIEAMGYVLVEDAEGPR